MDIACNEPVVRTLKVGPLQTLCHIVFDPARKQGVVIDPGAEEERIAAAVRMMGVAITLILNTHGHFDHVWGNRGLKELLGAPCAVHEEDQALFLPGDGLGPEAPGGQPPHPPGPDILLRDGQILESGGLSIRVIHTPGHSPGSACFLCGGHLFTGDTLFVGAVGRTCSLETLLESIEKKILPLPDSTIIHPGHDYGETLTSTLGREKRENIYITDFILAK